MLSPYTYPTYFADVVGIPLFDILEDAGGTLPDALLLAIIIGATTFAVLWGRNYTRRLDQRWAERDTQWSDSQRALREDWEATIETMRIGLRETFAQLSETHRAQLNSIQALVIKLEDHKTWTESCNLKHAALEEWKKGIDDRLREGAKKFEGIDQKLYELSQRRGGGQG